MSSRETQRGKALNMADQESKPRAIANLLVAVSLGGASDGFSKMLVHDVGFGVIMLARFLPTVIFLLALHAKTGPVELLRTSAPGLQALRGAAPYFISASLLIAVSYLPLAETTVILFVGPLLVVALSGAVLHEHVSIRSWIGVGLGFVAVVIVARPGLTSVSIYTVFPLMAAVFYALFQLLPRRLGAGGERPSTTLAWTMAVGAALSAPFAIAQWQMPTAWEWALLGAVAVSFGVSHYFFAKAFALAPANVLTPYSYFQIVAAVVFGLLAFGEFPDGWTIFGMILITAAGFYVFSAQRRVGTES